MQSLREDDLMGYFVEKNHIEKNEKKILGVGGSIKDIREAMEFFSAPAVRRIRPNLIEGFYSAKERVEAVLRALGLSLEEELPEDPVLKNKIWNEQILPKRKVLREIFKHEKLAMKIGVPENASVEELETLLAEIKKEDSRLKEIQLEKYRRKLQREIEASQDRVHTGPRGGRYRINSNGRKSYDVP